MRFRPYHPVLIFVIAGSAVTPLWAQSKPAAPAAPPPATTAAPTAAPSAAPTAAPTAAPADAPTRKPLAEALTGMARAEYESAKILYGAQDYASAASKFQSAYELSKDARLLFNIAVCQKNLRKYSRMLATVRRYLEDGKDILSADDVAKANEIVKTVQEFVTELKLNVDEKEAEVYVDNEKVGITPLTGAVYLDVGKRTITVKKKGFVDATTNREVAGGGTMTVEVRLEKEIHRGKLLVQAGPNDLISLDGKAVGRGKWEGSLGSGGHTLRVTAPGMAAYQSEVVIQDNQTRRVDVTLNTAAVDTTSTILWIAGGAALLAGAAVGGAFLFQPSRTPPIEGNFGTGTVQLSFGGKK